MFTQLCYTFFFFLNHTYSYLIMEPMLGKNLAIRTPIATMMTFRMKTWRKLKVIDMIIKY